MLICEMVSLSTTLFLLLCRTQLGNGRLGSSSRSFDQQSDVSMKAGSMDGLAENACANEVIEVDVLITCGPVEDDAAPECEELLELPPPPPLALPPPAAEELDEPFESSGSCSSLFTCLRIEMT